MKCIECYSDDNTKKPRLGDLDCLINHEQYICSKCGRYICIDEHKTRKLRRWNFPFKTFGVAKLYLRTADYINKKCCGVYEIISKTGRKSYKIFVDDNQMLNYLNNNKDKKCTNNKALFKEEKYIEYPNTEVRKLTKEEAHIYWNKKN
ncbi:MAG TPA: hypothetical protein PLV83_00125 [Bacilli bacterium]|nr:hypothetical protein [Bacilli bacterium]